MFVVYGVCSLHSETPGLLLYSEAGFGSRAILEANPAREPE